MLAVAKCHVHCSDEVSQLPAAFVIKRAYACRVSRTPSHRLPATNSRDASQPLQECLSNQVRPDQPLKRRQALPMAKRKVILLKPLQEDLPPVYACTNPIDLTARTDSDATSTQSLSFSPTSVLPRQHEPGVGNLFKALRQQASNSIPVSPDPSLHAVKQQQLGSWADKQIVHELSTQRSAVQPLPGAFESVLSGPTVFRQQAKPQQPTGPVINKRSTLDAAWRWKFKHQWGKEQLKYHYPKQYFAEDDEEACSDPWHDALHMIQAANTATDAGVPISDHDCYAEASPSPLLDSADLDGLLEDAPHAAADTIAAGPELMRSASSRALAEAAAKARELRKYQVFH